MANPLFTFRQYLLHQWKASNAHGLHSPFMFQFYNEAVKGDQPERFEEIKAIRRQIFQSKRTLRYTDPKTGTHHTETIGTWARRVTSSTRFACFLIRLIDLLGYKSILETGTASGLNAIALSYSNASKIVTLEGSEAIATIAGKNINTHGQGKITLIRGKVQDTFKKSIEECQPQLVFLDADHSYEAVRFYMGTIEALDHPPQCIILHDINWSKGMNRAWAEMVKKPNYALTIDLFEAGAIFPSHPMKKQHFRVQF